MNKFIGRLVSIGRSVRGAWFAIIFMLYLIKLKAFSNNTPETLLKVVQEFVRLATPTYKDKPVSMSRSMEQSSLLLDTLINKWFKDKSSVTLDQILEVIKNEFVRRK